MYELSIDADEKSRVKLHRLIVLRIILKIAFSSADNHCNSLVFSALCAFLFSHDTFVILTFLLSNSDEAVTDRTFCFGYSDLILI